MLSKTHTHTHSRSNKRKDGGRGLIQHEGIHACENNVVRRGPEVKEMKSGGYACVGNWSERNRKKKRNEKGKGLIFFEQEKGMAFEGKGALWVPPFPSSFFVEDFHRACC